MEVVDNSPTCFTGWLGESNEVVPALNVLWHWPMDGELELSAWKYQNPGDMR